MTTLLRTRKGFDSTAFFVACAWFGARIDIFASQTVTTLFWSTAVQAAYPRVPANLPQKAPFRDPDAILGGTWEALERVLKLAGYFSTGLRKLELARSVASHMDPAQNKSRSFQAFVDAVEAAKM
ncbi:DUF4276 family protein [Burkholderia sp. MSHR3999]|uniref:DUF4276 family protein n=1 Tax=Burkholderia sp. MSHR3999 TaxID=1542965 RepID=UPI001E43C6DA|nr:DUF4276 family protein [Burkholderia sp. MSHR3999]